AAVSALVPAGGREPACAARRPCGGSGALAGLLRLLMLAFLGIGAQKAGTTWLYRQLSRHPRVRFPGGKEVHFWNARIERDSLDWYRALFSSDPALVEGDVTPAYGILEPTVIRQIHDAFPDLRIIFIMRNPVARAWSSALMALGRAEMTLQDASEQWFLDHFHSQ